MLYLFPWKPAMFFSSWKLEGISSSESFPWEWWTGWNGPVEEGVWGSVKQQLKGSGDRNKWIFFFFFCTKEFVTDSSLQLRPTETQPSMATQFSSSVGQHCFCLGVVCGVCSSVMICPFPARAWHSAAQQKLLKRSLYSRPCVLKSLCQVCSHWMDPQPMKYERTGYLSVSTHW